MTYNVGILILVSFERFHSMVVFGLGPDFLFNPY